MQAYPTPSVQHHGLKPAAHQPSEELLTLLQPWPAVHTKGQRKRRQAVHHVGDMFDAAFALQTTPPPLFHVRGDDALELPEHRLASTEDTAADGAVKDGRKRRESPANTDGYSWKKYGEKVLKETGVPRSYYKCSVPGCNAKKYVEYTEEGDVAECIIKGEHNHSRSRAGARASADSGGAVRASTRRRQPKPAMHVHCVVASSHTHRQTTAPTRGSSSHSDSATPLAAAVPGNHALLDDYASSRQLPRDAHIITTPEKPIHSSGLRGSSRRKKRPAQRAHDAEDVYATALCDVPPFKLQRHFFTAQQLPWQGEEDVLSPRASSCEDASVHREPSMEGQASGSLCGTGAGASLRVGNSMVVNSPPSTPLKLQPVMLTAATPVALRV